jgi:hypothetical protein
MNDFIVGQMAHERQADLDREAARVALAASVRKPPAGDIPPGDSASGTQRASVRSLGLASAHRLAVAWHMLAHHVPIHPGHAPR